MTMVVLVSKYMIYYQTLREGSIFGRGLSFAMKYISEYIFLWLNSGLFLVTEALYK